ncbi:MAG: DNA-protecting protein DprA [Candidatus Pacebacteria bacterium]|nr:DNA-protecting protein DprA [Candidatus Paceibacterota bacterium]
MPKNKKDGNLKEKISYNALVKFHLGEYSKLKKDFEKFKSWDDAWKIRKKESEIDADKEWQNLQELKITLTLNTDSDFPKNLTEIPWPPFAIYQKGEKIKNEELIVAIVGTRKASDHGKKTAYEFAKSLSQLNVSIVSGLALGIDTEAHKGSLFNKKRTIAVLANSLETIYPSTNSSIAQLILNNNGVLVSEYPIGSVTLARKFIERNRIVSGLSKAIIVVEAPEKSGGMHTARFALDQNREIFVVPGNINNQNYKGSNSLIKAGANLMDEIKDIADFLEIDLDSKTKEDLLSKLDNEEKMVYDLISLSNMDLSMESICNTTKLSLEKILISLTNLEINNLIREKFGKYSKI